MASNKSIPGTKGKGSTAYIIPADKIADVRTLQIKFKPTEQDVLNLAQQISSAGGQLEPALIRLDASGQPVIWAGCTRRLAIMEINKDPQKWGFDQPLDLVCNLKEVPEGESTWFAAFQSNTLKPMSTMDLAKICFTFKESYSWPVKKIVESLKGPNVKLSQPKVDFLLGVMRLPSTVHDMIHDGLVKESWAKEIINLAKAAGLEDEEVICLADHMISKLTYKEYLAAVKAIMNDEKLRSLASMIVDADCTNQPITPRTLKEVVNRKKREEGVTIKRDLQELVKLCKTIDTVQSRVLVKWVEGNEQDINLIKLFTELREVE